MERVEFASAIKGIKNPARVVMAIVQDETGKVNPITLEWFMRTSIAPPMFAISVGHSRYSHDCLQSFRYFNLCYPSREMAAAVLHCGTASGRDSDKLKDSGLSWFKGRLAGLPIIREAAANFECKLISQIRSGDHTIFTGEVKYSWLEAGREPLLAEHLQ
ncbi:MAG: flavin reductase family protein [Candidatus Cloacimonetes bacterium]|nr:flavin reductase family protein [Candidatus Cloacimonadota bacterium]